MGFEAYNVAALAVGDEADAAVAVTGEEAEFEEAAGASVVSAGGGGEIDVEEPAGGAINDADAIGGASDFARSKTLRRAGDGNGALRFIDDVAEPGDAAERDGILCVRRRLQRQRGESGAFDVDFTDAVAPRQ